VYQVGNKDKINYSEMHGQQNIKKYIICTGVWVWVLIWVMQWEDTALSVGRQTYNYRNRIYSITPNETVHLASRVIYITDPLTVELKGSIQLMTRPRTGLDNPVFSKPIKQLIHSLEVLTTELLVKELNEMFPSHRILQQFLQTECPALHPPCRDVLPAWTKVNRATSIRHVH
jgi:hypothetical protein